MNRRRGRRLLEASIVLTPVIHLRRDRRLLFASIVLTLTAFALGGVLWTVMAGDSGGGASLRLPGWRMRAIKAELREECGSNPWRIHETETVPRADNSGDTLTRVRWEMQGPGGYWEQKDEVFWFDQRGELKDRGNRYWFREFSDREKGERR